MRWNFFFFCYYNQERNEMPNFGKLTQDLNGGTLSIGDNLVIDSHLNMHVGNISAGNVFCTLFTSKLVEQTSQNGINVYGNLHIESGFYLTGDFKITNETFENLNVNGLLAVSGSATITEDLTVDQNLSVPTLSGLTTGTGPIIKGNTSVVGGLSVSGPDLLVPQVICDTLCTEVAILNTLTPKTGHTIEVFGNLVVTGQQLTVPQLVCPDISPGSGQVAIHGNLTIAAPGVQLDVLNVHCNSISPLAVGGAITLTGNVDITGNCLTLAKQNGGPANDNIVYTSKSAGVVTYYTATTFNAFDYRTITLINPCIKSDSVVLIAIGDYTGSSLLIVSQIQVSTGQVDVTLFNLVSTINVGDLIPLQYLIH